MGAYHEAIGPCRAVPGAVEPPAVDLQVVDGARVALERPQGQRLLRRAIGGLFGERESIIRILYFT